ncbi:MAG: hypothetical protein JSS10_04070 [Verrucomicrobia bacterium]|nr:hypothetical protein [Verrucomicrobiota bacterium]
MANILPTLQSVTEKARGICDSVTGLNFRLPEATQRTEALYKDGIELVKSEVANQPTLKNQVVSPVVDALNSIVASSALQHQEPFHQSLSKAYRVFVELTWHQCWRQKDRPTFASTKQEIIDKCSLIKSNLTKDQAEAIFEYSCARQAGKCLTPSEGVWTKYLGHILELGSAAESKSVFGVLKSLFALGKDLEKEWVRGWYFPVYQLRWEATRITNAQGFGEVITPQLQKTFFEEGDQYTQCLATVYRDLIKSPEVDVPTKKIAVQGFIDLLRLEESDRVSRLVTLVYERFKHPRKVQKKLEHFVIKSDRYWLTRFMILQYIAELKQEPSFKVLLTDTITALLTVQKKSKVLSEKQAIREKLDSLAAEDKETATEIEKCRAFLGVRGGSEAQIKQTEETLQRYLKEQNDITEESQRHEWAQKVLPVLEELDKAEQEYLTKLQQL